MLYIRITSKNPLRESKHAEKTINGKYIINGVLTYSELDQEGGEVYSLM